MAARLAILAGDGALPAILAAAADDPVFVTFSNDTYIPKGCVLILARFEQFGALFSDLRNAGVTSVVMAGGMARPELDVSAFDAETTALFPRLAAAMSQGDDGLLRQIIEIFEEQGFEVRGAADIAANLTASVGVLAGPEPEAQDLEDAAKARTLLAALAPHDVGQGVVVAGGLCLGIETLQGTDALLSFVSNTSPHLRRAKGVLVKSPKPQQDLRVDMPAIGPDTIASAIKAGLAGVVIDADKVLILDKAKVIAACEAAGLFLLVQ